MNGEQFVNSILGLKSSDEWHMFECKRAATKPSVALNTIVALANTNGGLFVLGLEDYKKATGAKRLLGINENRDNISELLKLINQDITPAVAYQTVEIPIININGEKDHLCVIRVIKSNTIHSLRNGDTYIRRGNQNNKIGAEEIIRLKYEKGSISVESESADIKDLAELDDSLLTEYKNDTRARYEDKWQFLKDNGLVTNGFLNKGAILLFGKNPSIQLKSKVGIKISHYYGTEPDYSEKPNFVRKPFTIEGPLLVQIKKAIEYFRTIKETSGIYLSGATFQPTLKIPEWVFQEAIANAVIHRNYAIQDDIHIRIFANRIEVISPGNYPGNITPENIRQERFARNPILVRTLSRFQEGPNLDIGEGVDRMFQLMQEKNLYDPIYIDYPLHYVAVVLLNLQRVEYWDIVSDYLDENRKITNGEARKITGIKDTLVMTRNLNKWVSQKLLIKVSGKSKKDSYYIKSTSTGPINLFSPPTEIKNTKR
jgi:ATP-dependent DNA helicase RecG